MLDFYLTAAFPHMLWIVDGTYVNIRKPQHEAHTYIYRHGMDTMNMMVICNAQLIITDVVLKYSCS